jgi:hypothetical protein
MDYPIYRGDDMDIARLEFPPVYTFLDLIDDEGQAHGEVLVQLYLRIGWNDSTNQAAKVISTLSGIGVIQKADPVAEPSASQKFFGTGGNFKVTGKNAQLLCYNWVRGDKGLCRPALDRLLKGGADA